VKISALRVYAQVQSLQFALRDESGQELVEYALVLGLIAMGAVAGLNGLAGSIVAGFASIGTKVTSYTS
jgi:pilus assembly protein Flp/PilA